MTHTRKKMINWALQKLQTCSVKGTAKGKKVNPSVGKNMCKTHDLWLISRTYKKPSKLNNITEKPKLNIKNFWTNNLIKEYRDGKKNKKEKIFKIKLKSQWYTTTYLLEWLGL